MVGVACRLDSFFGEVIELVMMMRDSVDAENEGQETWWFIFKEFSPELVIFYFRMDWGVRWDCGWLGIQ